MANIGEIFQRSYRDGRKALVEVDAVSDAISRALGFYIQHEFDLLSGETKYLVLETADVDIHATNRTVRVVDLSTQQIEVRVTTYVDATVTTLGNDISDKIVNANFNFDNSIILSMYDETSVVDVTNATKVPFSGTITGDKKSVATTFISNEYVLSRNAPLVIAFENLGQGDDRIEYNAAGYQCECEV